jgi:hypothetical protein
MSGNWAYSPYFFPLLEVARMYLTYLILLFIIQLVLSVNIPLVHGSLHHSPQLMWQVPVPPWTWQLPNWHWLLSAHLLGWWPPHGAVQQFVWHAEPVHNNKMFTALLQSTSFIQYEYMGHKINAITSMKNGVFWVVTPCGSYKSHTA